MDSKLWLLVEFVEDKSDFSDYSIVNANVVIHDDDINNGKMVLIRDKHHGARQAQILRISDNKRYLKDFRVMLERQDKQVKNVVTLCMNTIKEMKTGQMLLDSNEGRSVPSTSRMSKLPEDVEMSTSDSDSVDEDHQSLNLTKSVVNHSKFHAKRVDTLPSGSKSRPLSDKTFFYNRKPLQSSTPLPEKHTLTFDQGTQTESEQKALDQIIIVAERLRSKILSLTAEVHLQQTNRLEIRSSEDQTSSESNVAITTDSQHSNGDVELDKRNKAKVLHVRRASAQTTNAGLMMDNSSDMVSIGSGNVTVPARLWSNLDWTSHTSVTRQLLQAVFPRRILATHSLSGKQSPAFVNKPPKQQLNPKIVNDIVSTVSERCGVPKRVIRSTITTKCTDEAKLYRNRLQQRKRERIIPESVSPLPSSNESSNTS